MKLPKLSDNVTFFERVSAVDKLTFTKHLSVMLKSGIPLSEAISIIGKQNSNFTFKRILKKIYNGVANGQELYKTLSLFPSIFDSFYIQLVRVGEQSGNLEKNLDYLAAHLKKSHEFSQKIRGALMYPTLVLIIAATAGIGLSLFVLPKLVDLFSSLDVEIPLSTKILLWFSVLMRDYGIVIFGGLLIVGIILKIIVSQSYAKPYWHTFLLSLPLIGVFLQNVQLAFLCRNMGTMLESGIPISQAFQTQKDSTDNVVYKEYLSILQSGIEKGKTLESIFDSAKFKFFPLIAIRMLGVGEKTGKLDESFSYLGDYFEDEVDNTSRNFSTLLEPVILLAVGLIVAFIAVSIIAPIYQFTGSIQQQ